MKLILFALVAIGLHAQSTISFSMPNEAAVSVTISTEAGIAVVNFIKTIPAGPSGITLNGTIASNATTAVFTGSLAGLTTGNGVLWDNGEISLITAISGQTLTLTRGMVGTTAASHTSGVAVTFLRSGGGGVFLANILADTIHNAMIAAPGPGVATQNTAHATAQAAIQTLINASVTHVP